MTKEEIREYINANEDIKKMLHRFMRHNDNIITSSLSEEEENKMHMIFMNAYKDDIDKLISKININSEAFKEYVKEEGISDFVEAKNMADGNIYNVENNPLADPSITEAQRKGLEEFHRWLNRNCEKTGFLGDDEAGGMRDFANRFMSQPASVQLKALYLLETGKRKAPDEAGFDDYNSQMNYVPSLDKIKKPLIASPLKIWKRANGNQFYWNKLNQSLKIAEKSKDKLERFRENLREVAIPEQGEKNIKEYSNINKLNSIVKLIDTNKIMKPSVNSETKEVNMVLDEDTRSRVLNCKVIADMINNLPANATAQQKERMAEDALNSNASVLPQINYKREGTKSFKGAWEVGTDIIAQKENYQNMERIFKVALALHNENKALGDPPPPGIVAYLNSDKTYLGDLPSNLFDGLNLASEMVNVISTLANIKKNYNDTNMMQKVTGSLNFISNISDGTFHTTQMLTSASKIIPSLKGEVDTFKDISSTAGAITGTMIVCKNIAVATKQGLNRYCATNAKMLAEGSRHLTDDEKKRINDIADFSHTKSVKTQHGAIRGMIKGAGMTSISAGGAALATVPIAGPVILAGVTGMSIYDQYRNRKDRKELARLAVDKLVTGSEKIEQKLTNHNARINARLEKYAPGDKTADKIRKFSAKQNRVKDRTRNEEAVKAGHTSVFTCTAGATNAVADELLKKVYLINPEKGFTKDNIITNSREHASYRIERTSYQELLESMGVEVKHKAKSEITDAKHFEKRLKEKKAAQLGS